MLTEDDKQWITLALHAATESLAGELGDRIGRVEKRLDAVEKRLGRLEADLGEVKADVKLLLADHPHVKRGSSSWMGR